MEKLKITVEQARLLKTLKSGNRDTMADFIETKGFYVNDYEFLNGLSYKDFALLLCGWYEVVQPFMVGDWVYDKANDKYWQLKEKVGRMYSVSTIFSISELALSSDNYAKVTEQWKIELLELGREKPELRIGDVYVTKAGNQNVVTGTRREFHLKHFEMGLVKRFHPVERSIEFK